jgi:hypothetical protein
MRWIVSDEWMVSFLKTARRQKPESRRERQNYKRF